MAQGQKKRKPKKLMRPTATLKPSTEPKRNHNHPTTSIAANKRINAATSNSNEHNSATNILRTILLGKLTEQKLTNRNERKSNHPEKRFDVMLEQDSE